MTTTPPQCPLCKANAETAFTVSHADRRHYECRRCGKYEIAWPLEVNLASSGTTEREHSLVPYLACFIRRRNQSGKVPVLTTENWEACAEAHAHTAIPEKIRSLLTLLAERSGRPGEGAQVDRHTDAPLVDALDSGEVLYYLRHLIEAGLVKSPETRDDGYTLTVAGWERLEPGPGGIPGRCFVAMAFDPSLDAAFSEGIERGIRDCGLDPVRVDRQHYNDKIDDQIIVEIRRAEFVIADVTRQRPGVYFEAGFALGLGRPVIWTCREDDFEAVHFDTRQYNHIVWSAPKDLREKLANRIRATIPSAQVR